MTKSIFDIPCPDDPDFADHPGCIYWKSDQCEGEWYCELHPEICCKMEEEPVLPYYDDPEDN